MAKIKFETGETVEVEDGYTPEDLDYIYQQIRKPKQEISTPEAMGAGFLSQALSLSKGLGGDVDRAQAEAVKAETAAKEQHPLAAGIGGMGVQVAAAAPGLVAGAPAGAGLLANMGIMSLTAGGAPGLAEAQRRYTELIQQGASEEEALMASGISGATTAVGFGAPASMGGSLARRLATGAGINVGIGEADRLAENAVLPNKLETPFTWTGAGINAALGAVAGAAGPKERVKFNFRKTSNESKVPYDPAQELEKRVQQRADGLQSRIDQIENQIIEYRTQQLDSQIGSTDAELLSKLEAKKEELIAEKNSLPQYGSDIKIMEPVESSKENLQNSTPELTKELDSLKEDLSIAAKEDKKAADMAKINEGSTTGSYKPTGTYAPHELPFDTPIRPDMEAAHIQPEGRDRNIGVNVNGKTYIDPSYIVEYFETKLGPNVKKLVKSPRGLQIFAEIHEATHNVVRPNATEIADWDSGIGRTAYEDRMNGMIIKEFKQYAETRKIPKHLLETFEERFSDDPLLNRRAMTEEEYLDSLGSKERPPQKTTDDNPPIEAYADEVGRVDYSKTPYDKTNQPRLIPAVHIEKLEKMLAHIKNKLETYNNLDVSEVRKLRARQESLEQQLETAYEINSKNPVDLSKVKTGSKKNQATTGTVEPKNSVFLDDADEMYQKLRNQGMSDAIAKNLVNQYYPNTFAFGSDVPSPDKNPITKVTKLKEGDILSPYGKVPKTAEEAVKLQTNVEDISSFSSKGLGNLFGKLAVGKMFEDSPLISFAVSTLHKQRQRATQLSNDLWFGVKNMGKRGKVFFSLQRQIADDSPAAVLSKLEDTEVNNVMAAFEEGFYNSRSYTDTFKIWEPRFSENEKQAFSAFVKMFERLGEGVETTRTGWFPAVRRGDFMVKLRQGGTPIHVEMMRTRAEADLFIKKVQQSFGSKVTIDEVIDVKSLFKNKDQDFELTRRVVDIIANEIAPTEKEAINKLIANMIGNPDPMAMHQRHRSGISGYEGSRLFESPAQRAESWKRALHTSVDEYANRHFRASVQRELSPILDQASTLSDTHPHTVEMVSLLRDVAMNKINSHIEGVDTTVYNVADKLAMDIAKKAGHENWFPKTRVWDRASGVSTRMFYIWSLTTRPAFWLAQAITSPMAIRQLLREDSIGNSLVSAGKGTANILYGGSPEFKKAVFWAAQNTETFHPSFINDLNQLVRPDQKNFANKVFEVLTGERMSTAADSFSRYWTFSMMYEHYKSKGLKGVDLYKKAAFETDTSMILYSRSEKAPIFTRMGIAGQQASPLMTFAQGNLGNLLADLRLAKKTGNLAPIAMTLLMTTLLGGAVGLPFLGEWEVLRRALISVDSDLGNSLPSPSEIMMKNLPDALAFGIPSAATGLDVGSGLRFNPMAGSLLKGDSPLSMFPAAAFATQMFGNSVTTLERFFGAEVTDAEYRKAQMQMTPGGYKGITDDVMFDATTRKFVPDQKRGFGVVEQTPKERAATYLGTKTMERAKEERILYQVKQKQADLLKAKQHKIDIIVDKIGRQESIEKEAKELVDLGMEPNQITKSIMTAIKARNNPALERLAGTRFKTLSQIKRYQDIQGYNKNE